MARNDVRPTLFVVPGDGEVQKIVQGVQFALNAAAPRDVDERITGGHKDIACRDHVRTPEVYDAVAIGVGGLFMRDVDGLVIEPERLAVTQERVGGPRGGR